VAAPNAWTVEEANVVLPRIQALLDRLAAGDAALTPQVAAEALHVDGIVLRDAGRGLIDFTAVAPSGRPYWLCWLAGEPEVAWWHWVEDGFAGRRRLDDPPE